ncbi:HNH endonuclease, partial [Methylicorpusculum sp.]|uniref:HNH endonuclease n=1 Tax=Methylicorpusculum sp. TaxID=2713644 RepID=UPI002ABC0D43
GDAVSARPALQSFAVGSTLGGGIGLATAYPLATGLTLTSLELSSLASGDMPVGIPTINGRLPINSSYAGQIHPSGIPFTSQGFPDFSSVTKAEVQIQSLTGNYAKDSALANQAVGISQTPTGFVWHHVEDGLTMQLISQDIHNAVRHTGGAAVIRNGGFD